MTLSGPGLFTGQVARVGLARKAGRIAISVKGRAATLEALCPVAFGRTSALEGEGIHLSCVEHLFAALAGNHVRDGLSIEVDQEELPLLDGGAQAWSDALAALGFAKRGRAPALRVVEAGKVAVDRSEYTFSPPPPDTVVEPMSGTCSIQFETSDPRLATFAEWRGDAADFTTRIAAARTFVAESDLTGMLEAGGHAHVDPKSVIVIGERAIHCAGRPFEADEPARHKLLDLIGDLALHGGPPLGHVHARRPGHAATHCAMAEAKRMGLVTEIP